MSGINPFEETADALPASILEEWIVWCRKRPMHRTGRPLGPASVQTYFYAVSGCFKWAARRKLLPERFRWAEMFANATETLGKLYSRSARHDRRVPLLVAYVDNLPMPDAGKRLGVSRLELLRDRALLHLLLSSGMRREEVLTLNRARHRGGLGDVGRHHRQGLERADGVLGLRDAGGATGVPRGADRHVPAGVHSPGQPPRRAWPGW